MAEIYNSNKEPCAIVTKSDVAANTALFPTAHNVYNNNLSLASIIKNTDDPGCVLPFQCISASKKYNYSNETSWNTVCMAENFYSNNIAINKANYLQYMNDNHGWKSCFPNTTAWSGWKAYINNNKNGSYDGDNRIYHPIYNHFTKMMDSKLYSTISANYNTTNVGFTVKPSNDKDYGTDIYITSTTKATGTATKVNFGFNAIISGSGLSNYIKNIKSNDLLKQWCLLGIKGGHNNKKCYDSASTSNCMLKYYTFNPDITAFYLPSKELKNDVWYIEDKQMTKMSLYNTYSKSRITKYNSQDPSYTIYYYDGPTAATAAKVTYSWTANGGTVFTSEENADEIYDIVYSKEITGKYVVPGQAKSADNTYDCTCIDQPHFWYTTTASTASIQSYTAQYFITGISGSEKYMYAGPVETFSDSYVKTYTNYYNATLFSNKSQCDAMKSKLCSTASNYSGVSWSETYAGDYATATNTIPMPPVRFLSLNYYVTKA